MRRWIVSFGAAWIAAMVGGASAGCVLGGPDEPGCSEDAECGEGFSCRAGACFRETSGATVAPPDGGDDADAE